ncbi:MAG TPA: hypothetical protein VNL14_14700 [Candidatus Acidoferrales bacterium]|nr:hypothetical protein [Candidatus Acidoferrales bacterium]
MAIGLDHTVVPAKDKHASAKFSAEIFGLEVMPGRGILTLICRQS